MNINLNKDFSKEYKEDFIRGFTLKEALSIGCALVTIIGVVFGLWKVTGWSPDICVYVGVPFAVPILAVGFYTYQGMSVIQLIKEIYHCKKIVHLTFEAEERQLEDAYIFRIESLVQGKRKNRKHHKQKLK